MRIRAGRPNAFPGAVHRSRPLCPPLPASQDPRGTDTAAACGSASMTRQMSGRVAISPVPAAALSPPEVIHSPHAKISALRRRRRYEH